MNAIASRQRMRWLMGCLVALILMAVPAASQGTCGPDDRVTVNGRDFTCGGDPFRFVGVNIPFLANIEQKFTTADSDPAAVATAADGELRDRLRDAYDMGARVVRFTLPWNGKLESDVAEGLREILDVSSAYPEMKFIVVLTDFYLMSNQVVTGDAATCNLDPSLPEDQQFPSTCAYHRDSSGLIVLRQEWFRRYDPDGNEVDNVPCPAGTVSYSCHYKPFVQSIVGQFSDEPQILAWELGNELSTNPVTDLQSFSADMAAVIRDAGAGLVTSGFISSYHATSGATSNPGDLYGSGTPFDFATVHGYNGDWAQTGTAGNGVSLDVDWFFQNNFPWIVEEISFTGALPSGSPCADAPFPGQLTWRGVDLDDTVLRRSHNMKNLMNLFFNEISAEGLMQWGFNSGGDARMSPHPCLDMDNSQIPAMASVGHTDFWDLHAAYSCQAQILAAPPGTDLYVKSLRASQSPSGGPISFEVVVRNGGTAATGGRVLVNLYVGPRGTDPFNGGNATPDAGAFHNYSLLSGQEATVSFSWTPTIQGELTFAVVARDEVGNTEPDRTCNNGFYRDCQILGCGPTPTPTPAPSSASGIRSMTGSSVLTFCAASRPNLKPTAITSNANQIFAGNPVFFDSGVRNDGAASPGFNVRWLVDGMNVGAVGGHGGVPANSTVLNGNSQFTWTAVEGIHTIAFQVDSDNTVAESNETDNLKLVTVTVAPAARPDLKPVAISYGGAAALVEGREILFDSGVQNLGVAAACPFIVRWLIDGQEAGSFLHGSVPAETTVRDDVASAVSWTATAGTHVIEFLVDSLNQVNEVNEANNLVRLSITVAVAPKPDLLPTTIRYVAANLVVGADIVFDSGVRNAGTADAGIFNVKWLVDGREVGAHGSHGGVAAGATVLDDNSGYIWRVEPGQHTITFIVDVDHMIAETNEGNNQKTITVAGTVSPIDLLPTAISYPAAGLYAGSPVTFDSGVRNAGTEASGSFNVRWLVDGQDVGAHGPHVSVPAGTTITGGNSAFIWEAEEGTHTLTFIVDTDNHVPESNEGNNQKIVTVTVAPAPRPDLKPTAIHYTAASAVVGTPVFFDSGVTNAGQGASGSFNVRWLVDGQPVGADGLHGGVAAGAAVLDGNSQFTWNAQAGTHTIAFVVDYDNQVGETNELNNSTQVVVTPLEVELADLRPTSIRFSAASLQAGSSVSFDSGLQNAGPGDSPGFNVRWLVDGQLLANAYGFHGGVPAGATVLDGNSQFTWEAQQGTHTIGFYVDADNTVRETNETNNLRTVTVTVQGPLLQNGDMETHTTSQFGGISFWGPNGGWSFHSQFPRPNNGSLGSTFGFYSAGTAETFGQVTGVLIAPNRTYIFKSWAYPGVNDRGRLPYQIGYAAVPDSLSSFVPLATAVVDVNGRTSWFEAPGVSWRSPSSGAAIGKQLIVRFGSGANGGDDDIWFDNLTLTVQ